MALVLIGEGQAYYNGKLMSGAAALKKAGLQAYHLGAKEGLSLINGTQIMTAIGSLALYEAIQLAKIADIAGAISLEATRGSAKAFHAEIQKLRPHPTQIQVAENMRRLLQKSAIAQSHIDCAKVQDSYSFRCIPQVHGASRKLLNDAADTLAIEMNAVTDNPLVIFPNGKAEVISGGNFHGEFVAMALDTAAIAVAEIANISDLRMQKLINPAMNGGLPAFLTPDAGLHSGMMIVQVAAAALVSENKILSHPASVDSIPTSADKEDHVSMGVTAAKKFRQIVENTRNVLSMELLCGTQGLEFLQPMKAGVGAQLAYEHIRKSVRAVKDDRPFHIDIQKINQLIKNQSILMTVEKKAGALW
jgi:histidine ammonia-lyase